MKVLLLNASSHEFGTTWRALDEIARTLNQQDIETEIFWAGKEPIKSCEGCAACQKLGRCIYNDIVNEYIEKAKKADGYIMGTPVHFAAANGQITALLGRAFYAGKKYFSYKPVAGISVARRAGTTSTFDQLNKFFSISNMPIVTSCYWNNVFGSNSQQAEQDQEGLFSMQLLAKNMVWLLKCIEYGKNNGINHPELISPPRTNFIR